MYLNVHLLFYVLLLFVAIHFFLLLNLENYLKNRIFIQGWKCLDTHNEIVYIFERAWKSIFFYFSRKYTLSRYACTRVRFKHLHSPDFISFAIRITIFKVQKPIRSDFSRIFLEQAYRYRPSKSVYSILFLFPFCVYFMVFVFVYICIENCLFRGKYTIYFIFIVIRWFSFSYNIWPPSDKTPIEISFWDQTLSGFISFLWIVIFNKPFFLWKITFIVNLIMNFFFF